MSIRAGCGCFRPSKYGHTSVCSGCFKQTEGGIVVWYVVPSCPVHGGGR